MWCGGVCVVWDHPSYNPSHVSFIDLVRLVINIVVGVSTSTPSTNYIENMCCVICMYTTERTLLLPFPLNSPPQQHPALLQRVLPAHKHI